MNGIIPCIQGLQFLHDSGTGRFHFFDLLGKISQVVFLNWGECYFLRIVEIKIFLWAIVGVVGGVETNGEKERLAVLLL